jgi:hypothetical protein
MEEYQVRTFILEEEIKKLDAERARYKEKMDELKEDQKKLIEDLFALFFRHDNHLKELLKQLEEGLAVKKSDLILCENLLENAQKKNEKISARKI